MKSKFFFPLICLFCFLLGYGTSYFVFEKPLSFKKPSSSLSLPAPSKETKEKPKEKTPALYETYTVRKGDTLFLIGLKYNLPWLKIAELNNLTEPYTLKEGQVLKIPKAKEVAKKTEIEIDLEKEKEFQFEVEAGKESWRLDPVEVVKATSPASFQFTALDSYNLISKDLEKGEALVEVKKSQNSKTIVYEVNLIQPVKKGEGGIWAISSISELK